MTAIFKQERDTIAGLGMLSATYVRFDPELITNNSVSHARGYNVQSLIIDNADGDVLAIEGNRIHQDGNPLQHAEQMGVRAAIARLHEKRPRDPSMSVESYYKTQLFMAPGKTESDFENKGCTLYNTFDPCGMCAVTLLVSYMKRIAYLFDDATFEKVYEDMRFYFKNRDSVKESLSLVEFTDAGNPLVEGAQLISGLRTKVNTLKQQGTMLVMTLDKCYDDLKKANELFLQVTPSHFKTTDAEKVRNENTLVGIRRLLNLN
ncbi:MAG: hypothetical protein K2Y39_09560 [Candidatus Obscuribacterales bacterium]|nr:hypothetical protein [Candidatus Obscuribacterales bacterium]